MVRKSLPYHNIPRRPLGSPITYDRDIDMSAMYFDPDFRDEEFRKMRLEVKEMSRVKNHEEFNQFYKTLEDPDMDEVFPSYNDENLPYVKSVKTGPKDLYGPLVSPEEQALIDKLYAADKKFMQAVPNSDITWIQTYSGKKFNPIAPISTAIVIEDIAHALSNICRFTGHCRDFYSVAQHCVLVSHICDWENALAGLLHDGSEAYCQDIASPVKKAPEFAAYREVEDRLQLAIFQKFGAVSGETLDVKRADAQLLATEARDLMNGIRTGWVFVQKPLPFKIEPLPPKEAEKLFLERFNELYQAK